MALLQACKLRKRKTALFRSANMNFRQGQRYLDTCLDEGLVRREGDLYTVTQDGRQALEHWREVETVLPDLRSRRNGSLNGHADG